MIHIHARSRYVDLVEQWLFEQPPSAPQMEVIFYCFSASDVAVYERFLL